MSVFYSLQAAKDFINKQACEYVRNLQDKGYRVKNETLMWHMNEGALVSMFIDNGYYLPSEYAQQAMLEAFRKGYIEEIGFGGIRITPQGLCNIGSWY